MLKESQADFFNGAIAEIIDTLKPLIFGVAIDVSLVIQLTNNVKTPVLLDRKHQLSLSIRWKVGGLVKQVEDTISVENIVLDKKGRIEKSSKQILVQALTTYVQTRLPQIQGELMEMEKQALLQIEATPQFQVRQSLIDLEVELSPKSLK